MEEMHHKLEELEKVAASKRQVRGQRGPNAKSAFKQKVMQITGRVDQYYAYQAGVGEDPDGRMSAETSIKAIAKAKAVAMLNPPPDVRKVP